MPSNSPLKELEKEQEKKGYISKKKLREISKKTCLPESKVFSAATFYSFLSMEKRANHIIQVCTCPTCCLHGAEKILKHLEKKLGIKTGQATEDEKIYLGRASYLGLCDKAPAIMVDGKPCTKMNKNKINKLVEKLK